jgi:hypothetical protein
MLVRVAVRLALQAQLYDNGGLKRASSLCLLGRTIDITAANLPKISRAEPSRPTDRPFQSPAFAIQMRTDGSRPHSTRAGVEVI